MRRVLRDERRTGVRVGEWRRQLERDRARPSPRAVRGSPDPEVIQVVLPKNLQILAGVGRNLEVQVSGPVTQRSILDALEASYPALLGTMRDRNTKQRRSMIRFF